jgi:hypothetical protein
MSAVVPTRAAARPARRGFIRSQVAVALATIVGLAATGIAILPWLLASPQRVSRLIAAAIPELQADVTIEAVRVGWAGPMSIDGIRVMPHDGGQTPMVIRRIEVSHGLAGIILSGGDLGRIRIEGLVADVVFAADRTSNLATLFRPRADDAAGAAAGGPKRSAVRLVLDVPDAVVRIAGPWTPEPWVSDPIAVRATLGPAADGPHSEWVVEPVQLLTDARLEPGIAQGVLAYVAPVLADATRTSGRFSLRLDEVRLPVGDPASGRLSGELAMHEVVLGPGPLVLRTFASLPLGIPPPPNVRIADESRVEFHLADRRIWHRGLEFGLPLAKPGQRLDVESSGAVGLDDRSLDVVLTLPIPADLPQDRPLVAALAGKQISLGIGGFLGAPEVKFDGSILATAGDVAAELLERLRQRRQAAGAADDPGVARPRRPLLRRRAPPVP